MDVGNQWRVGTNNRLTPRIGFDYQSLITNSAFGYRNLMGPKLELTWDYSWAEKEFVRTELFANLFDSNFNVFSPSNYQWGGRLMGKWNYPVLGFQTFLAGVEVSGLRMQLFGADLSSSVINTFFGIQF